jgi:hypothetical protein
VFVLLVGDLGSHHSPLSQEVFRGFALADKRVPFIVINDQDAKTARSFTLIHELTHIFSRKDWRESNAGIKGHYKGWKDSQGDCRLHRRRSQGLGDYSRSDQNLRLLVSLWVISHHFD